MNFSLRQFFLGNIIGFILVSLGFILALPIQAHATENASDSAIQCSAVPSTVPSETPSVTPTETPEETPLPLPTQANNQPSNTPSTPGPAVCILPFSAPILQGFTRLGATDVTFSWWKSLDMGVEQQSLVYGYTTDNLSYGVLLPNDSTSYTVHDLKPWTPVYAQVWSLKNGCAAKSAIVEP